MKTRILLLSKFVIATLLAFAIPQMGNAQCTNFKAGFTDKVDSAKCVIYFTNSSSGTDSTTTYSWTFGDGTKSTDKNPQKSYSANGTFTVCMWMVKKTSSGFCRDSICRQITVKCNNSTSCTVKADFTYKADSGNCKKIVFTNTSTSTNNTTIYKWTFGNGTSATDKSPAHTYNDSGTKTVCLLVEKKDSNRTCKDSICKTITVCPGQTNTCKITAYFTYKADSANPSKIYFTNASTPVNNSTYYTWTFGNGTSSTASNPNITYSSPGTYQVCLKVKKVDGNYTCYDSICKTVTITNNTGGCKIDANFTWIKDSANCKKIKFTNTSTQFNSTTIFKWVFGDSTTSTDKNPIHEYTRTGTFTVCLLAIKVDGKDTCADTTCKTVTVNCDTGRTCTQQAYFIYTKDSSDCKKVAFTNLSTSGGTMQSFWKFGDGNTSTAKSPTHTYKDTGKYWVCLKMIWLDGGKTCTDSICKYVNVVCNGNNCTVNADFMYKADSSNCKKIMFKAIASSNGNFKWYFGDNTTATTYDASHTYSQGGNYNVCHVVTKMENGKICKDSVCKRLEVCTTKGIHDIENGTKASIYPNPFNNELTVTLASVYSEPITITIADMLGKTLHTETLPAGTVSTTMATAGLARGLYIVEITLDTITLHRQKLVK